MINPAALYLEGLQIQMKLEV